MNVLLINANPVVSRLFSLCTQDDEIVLYEISDISQVDDFEYEVVFIDDDSYNVNSETFLLSLHNAKKVLIAYNNKPDSNFEEVIKKPFLPSKIIETIKRLEEPFVMSTPKLSTKLEKDSFDALFEAKKAKEKKNSSDKRQEESTILDTSEIDKIKSLLEMQNKEEAVAIKEEEFEARKVEVIKEHLLADGLEIVEEDEIVEKLTKKEQSKEKKFVITDEDLELIEEAVEIVMTKLSQKQMRKLLKGKEIEIKIKLEDIDE